MDATLQADPRIQILSNHRNMWCFSQSGTTLRAAAIFVHMAGLMKPTNSPIVYIFHLEWAFIHGCKACAVRDFPFVDLFLFGQVKTVHCIGTDLRDCNHLKYLGQPVVVKLFCRGSLVVAQLLGCERRHYVAMEISSAQGLSCTLSVVGQNRSDTL